MILEQEIKLALNTDQFDIAAIELPGYQVIATSNKRLVSHYFDTAQQDLLQQGYGLRLRFDGAKWFQTVKASGHVESGLHQRHEWEHAIQQDQFDLILLKQTPLKAAIENEALWPQLNKQFTTDFNRVTQLIRSPYAEIELAYDRGMVSAGNEQETIHELELELKHGKSEALIELADILTETGQFSTSDISKAQRGYALLKT